MQVSDKMSRSRWHLKVGIVALLAGIAVLKPAGFLNALLAGLNKVFGLGLTLNPPLWVGIFLIFVGLIVIGGGEWLARQSNPKSRFLALHHHSLGTVEARLMAENLPNDFQDCLIQIIDCDLSRYLSAATNDLVGAIRFQQEKIRELSVAITTFSDVPVGYYGLAHIPFQFLAGCTLSAHSRVHLFDLDRRSNRWKSLSDGRTHFAVNVHTVELPPDARAVAIRISISYEVTIADVRSVLPGPIEDIRIGLPTPRIDAIVSYDQVDQICTKFRKTLDDIHSRVDKGKVVHIFYAGPAALGYSLGRQISKTIHHRIAVHNYESQREPHYTWASRSQPTIVSSRW